MGENDKCIGGVQMGAKRRGGGGGKETERCSSWLRRPLIRDNNSLSGRFIRSGSASSCASVFAGQELVCLPAGCYRCCRCCAVDGQAESHVLTTSVRLL